MSILPKTVAVLLVACCVLPDTTFAFQTPLAANSYARQLKAGPASRHETSLQMGLRSFLKKKVLGKDDVNGSTKASEPTKKKKAKAETVASENVPTLRTSIPEAPVIEVATKTREAATKTENGAAPKKERKLPPLRPESVKDRLNRVRSGKMTEDEKQAFLRTALSAKATATSRKPLRQAIPDGSDEDGNSKGNASPFPKDSLHGIFAAGQGRGSNNTDAGDAPVRNWKDGLQLQDQKKKREYLDMVTDPNRFHTYRGSVVTPPGKAEDYPSPHDGLVIPQMEDDDDVLVEGTSSPVKMEQDLGSRLEMAAIAYEEANQAKEQERLKEEERLHKERMEQKKRLEALNLQQQREQEKRELELKARKREEEEAMQQEIERRRKEEAVRQRKLMAAQDAYWAKKLEAERAARMRGMTQKQKDEYVKQEALEAEKAMEIAKEESLESMEEEPQHITSVPQMEGDPYEREQARKQAERERAKEEQMARLKALNSPLPSTASRSAPSTTPVVPPTGGRRGASELSKLMNTPKPIPPMPVSEPPAELTIAEMTEIADEGDEQYLVSEEETKNNGLLGFLGGGKKKEEPVRQAIPKGETKRVVRQELPLGDEDDFDTFARDGPNQEMSIADAMNAAGVDGPSKDQEQRSRMWGVDMSRIAQSLEDEKKGTK